MSCWPPPSGLNAAGNPIVGGSVTFTYSEWITRYPEFAFITQAQAQLYFNEATGYLDNTVASPIYDASVGGIRDTALNMLTAHIAAIYNPSAAGQPASPLVGRIASATEGSVTVNTDNQYPAGSVQWYQQTKYGSSYWAYTSRYRKFRYARGHVRNMDPYRPF